MAERINKFIDYLECLYNHNTYTILGRISNSYIFMYITIFVVFLFFAKVINVSLSLIFFIIIALVICYIIYSKQQIQNITPERESSIKLNLIIPRPKKIANYPDLISFLYDIRDTYYINPNDFYAIINNIDNFIDLYDQIMNDKMIYCMQNLEVAVEFARNALNHLHSIIYSLDVHRSITKEFWYRLQQLQFILRQYISRMIRKCNSEFNSNNINNTTIYYPEFGPKPFNYFSNKNGENQFEFF